MKYTKDIKRVQKMISDLKRIQEILTQVEDAVLGIEQEVTDIDNALPGDTEFAAMADGPEKQELSRLFDLNDEAYDLIDEILGPPEEEISVEEMLRQFPSARKGQAN
ncbi:MAG: hypothetical protein IJ654_08360 [Bacteroidales bacterium]|nr:hypothetical protein [Bacteroidales bacterium]